MRTIDPCGFVDPAALKAELPDFASYTYGWADEIDAPRVPRGLSTCVLRFENDSAGQPGAAIELTSNEGDNIRIRDGSLAFTTAGVEVRRCDQNPARCNFYVDVPVADLPGAPADMPAPVLMIRSGRPDDSAHTARGIAEMVARRLSTELPRRGDESPVQIPMALQDPCASVDDVPGAAGFDWYEPQSNTDNQYTWRNPYHCSIELGQAEGSEPKVVDIDFGLWRPARADSAHWKTVNRDGRDYTVETRKIYNSCYVTVRAGDPVPGRTATGAPSDSPDDLRVPVVAGSVPGDACDVAQDAAIGAVRRAIG